MKILVTGCAGFIGFHTSLKLLKKNFKVIGVDSLNNYYSKKLKQDRLKILLKKKNFTFVKGNLSSKKIVLNLIQKRPNLIVHLAAQAGVRHSLEFPKEYIKNNIYPFLNILEVIKNKKIPLIYASTSSVYGGLKVNKFEENLYTNQPLQFYAVTKLTNELMAHAYFKLYNISSIGLRFFTVYGPWGRPDMALFKFTKNIILNKKINVFNYGNHSRDFTYVEDIAESILRIAVKVNKQKESKYLIFNIGNGSPVKLLSFIKILEVILKKKSIRNLLPLQQGDVPNTFASTKRLTKFIKFKPQTDIKVGVKKFIDWYLTYYKIKK